MRFREIDLGELFSGMVYDFSKMKSLKLYKPVRKGMPGVPPPKASETLMASQDRKKVGIEHEGIERDDDADDAVLFDCQGSKVWLPRSELGEYDETTLVIPRWLADDRDLEPDWEL